MDRFIAAPSNGIYFLAALIAAVCGAALAVAAFLGAGSLDQFVLPVSRSCHLSACR